MKRQPSHSIDGDKMIMAQTHAHPTSNHKRTSVSGGKSEKRKLAALKCWEKRRARRDVALSAPVTIVPSMDDALSTPHEPSMSEIVQPMTDNSKSSGQSGAKSNKRRLAALKTWEKRRKDRANLSLKPDASPSSATDERNVTHTQDEIGSPTDTVVCVVAPSLKRLYTSELRSQAAKAAWEKRRRSSKAAKEFSSNILPDSTPSQEAITASKLQHAKSNTNAVKKRKTLNHGAQQHPEIKRSRPRRTSQDCTNSADTTKNANELINRLRFSRGWMEFHPSSRYGSGTADYAYIPGSLAQLIRNGAFSKPIVLENGTLGIHYALDYEGYGGLKAMIETFGEDYSPFPSEKMMEASREFQEKKDNKIEQWDIGEDLPWREVSRFEDEDMKRKCVERKNELQEHAKADSFSNMPDIEAVAEILASLIEANGVIVPCTDQAFDKSAATSINYTKQERGGHMNVALSNKNDKSRYVSPALLALQCYESDDDSLGTMESSNQEPSEQQVTADEVICMASQDFTHYQSKNNYSINSYDDQLERSFSNAPCGIFGIPLHSQNEIAQRSKKQYKDRECLLFTQGSRSLVCNHWNFGLC